MKDEKCLIQPLIGRPVVHLCIPAKGRHNHTHVCVVLAQNDACVGLAKDGRRKNKYKEIQVKIVAFVLCSDFLQS